MSEQSLNSMSVNVLRFPLAIMILVGHVLYMPVVGGSLYELLNKSLYGFIEEYAVSIYFFIAGYVFFYNIVSFDRETYFYKLKKRIKTIVVPYLIWNTIAIVLTVCKKSVVKYVYSNAGGPTDLHLSIINILKCYWNYDGMLVDNHSVNYGTPLNSPLWFLRSLMILALLSPLLYRILKSGFGVIFVILTGCLWLAVRPCEPSSVADYMFYQCVWSMFFFSWGGVMSINKISTDNIFGVKFKVSILLYVIFGLLSAILISKYPTVGSIIKGVAMITGVVFAFNLANRAVRCGFHAGPKVISAGVFIYMSHILFAGALFDLISLILPPTTEYMMIAVKLLTVILLCGLLMALFSVLQRYMPKLLNVIIGR